MYGKLFESTFTGSMYGRGAVVFQSGATAIAHGKPDGSVEINPRMLAATLGESLELVQSALQFLQATDPESRTKTEDGKRLIRESEYLYRIVNFQQYRNIRNDEERREYNRRKQAEHRAKAKASNRPSLTVIEKSALSAHSDSDSDSDSDSEAGRLRGFPWESPVGPVDRIFQHWQSEFGHQQANLSPKRRKLILGSLKAFTESGLCQGHLGYKLSPHHMGQNDRHTVYDDISLMLRDTEHIEAGLGFYRAPPPKLSEVENRQGEAELRINGAGHAEQNERSVGQTLRAYSARA